LLAATESWTLTAVQRRRLGAREHDYMAAINIYARCWNEERRVSIEVLCVAHSHEFRGVLVLCFLTVLTLPLDSLRGRALQYDRAHNNRSLGSKRCE
jgi:hypothetical protein